MSSDFNMILEFLRDSILLPFEIPALGHYYEYFVVLLILSIVLPLVLVIIKFLLRLRNVGKN